MSGCTTVYATCPLLLGQLVATNFVFYYKHVVINISMHISWQPFEESLHPSPRHWSQIVSLPGQSKAKPGEQEGDFVSESNLCWAVPGEPRKLHSPHGSCINGGSLVAFCMIIFLSVLLCWQNFLQQMYFYIKKNKQANNLDWMRSHVMVCLVCPWCSLPQTFAPAAWMWGGSRGGLTMFWRFSDWVSSLLLAQDSGRLLQK